MSGGVSDPSPDALAELKSAIEYAGTKNVLLVVAAGNYGRDIDQPENVTYPACFPLDNILTVAMIDFKGGLVSYKVGDRVLGSNYSRVNVDIAALDENFSSMVENGRSTHFLGAGTSCSGPVVAGIGVLVLFVKPDLSALALKKLLIDTAARLPSLEGKTVSGGMVNAYRALVAARLAG